MQTKEELEQWYKNADPWAYESTHDDLYRKEKILSLLPIRYNRAIDIGCGEGFVTRDLPAEDIHGIELSDLAASRLPWNIKRVHAPEGIYDLVMTTGTLYEQYNHEQIAHWIKSSACRHILIAGIKDWLKPYVFGNVITQIEFSYRQFIQSVTLYEVGS
jgi:hypothetical protein